MKFKLLLIKAIIATVFLICTIVAPASAIPILPEGSVIFEFNSWEYLTNRNPQDDNNYQLGIGDVLAGAVKLDSVTNGISEIYSPDANGVEVTGVFGGFKVLTTNLVDLDSDGIPDFINYTFDTSNAWLEIYFDEAPNFDPQNDTQAQSMANASDGDALLKLDPQILTALTNTNDSLGTPDDQTDAKAWLNLSDYDSSLADPFDWNNPSLYQWGDIFENPAGSGTFFAFYLTQAIYSPGHQKFEQYAGDTDYNGDRLWDYYDSDDLEGSFTTIPEPTTILLFGFGLLSLASLSRSRKV